MEFDLFTFIAEIVNFLLLVWLLNKFLFKRIITMVDAREKRIADTLAQADAKEKSAADREAAVQTALAGMEARKDVVMAEAADQMKALRETLGIEARAAAEKERLMWLAEWRRLRLEAETELAAGISGIVISSLRNMMKELADEDLERRVVARFITKLKTDQSLFNDLPRVPAFEIRTCYTLDPHQEKSIRDIIAARLNARTFELTTRQSDLFGIEIIAGGERLAWHVDDHLEQMRFVLDNAIRKIAEAGQPVDSLAGKEDSR
ncbi:MAG: hypothetical protein HZC28_10665 [Spirochaetes bacterium]|nr:hypothetical protein [Spirochaetota bacterium]